MKSHVFTRNCPSFTPFSVNRGTLAPGGTRWHPVAPGPRGGPAFTTGLGHSGASGALAFGLPAALPAAVPGATGATPAAALPLAVPAPAASGAPRQVGTNAFGEKDGKMRCD